MRRAVVVGLLALALAAPGAALARPRCKTCPRDAHGRILRSASARDAFMRQTGYPHGRPGYVVDHDKKRAWAGMALLVITGTAYLVVSVAAARQWADGEGALL